MFGAIGTTDDGFVRTAWDQASILEYPIAASKNDQAILTMFIIMKKVMVMMAVTLQHI